MTIRVETTPVRMATANPAGNIPNNLPESSEPIQKDPPVQPPKKSIAKSIAKKTGRFTIATLKWSALGSLLLYAASHIPGVSKGVNLLFREVGVQPKPVASKTLSPSEFIEGKPIDMFIAGNDKDNLISESVKDLKEDRRKKGINSDLNLDLDNSGWVLDRPAEIEKLRYYLQSENAEKYKDTINFLKKLEVLSLVVFSPDGPKPDDLIQNGRPNCEAMGALQAILRRTDGEQKLKQMIEIDDFNFSSNDEYKIDAKFVLSNGEKINIPWEKLTEWMSHLEASYSKKGGVYVPIATFGMHESSKAYGGIPGWFPSSSLVNLTGDNITAVPVASLSDYELHRALISGRTIKIATSNTKWDNIRYKDLKTDIDGIFDYLFDEKTKIQTFTPSQVKEEEFKQSTKNLTEKIKADVIKDPILPASKITPISIQTSPPKTDSLIQIADASKPGAKTTDTSDNLLIINPETTTSPIS